jgi:hypothetical protein
VGPRAPPSPNQSRGSSREPPQRPRPVEDDDRREYAGIHPGPAAECAMSHATKAIEIEDIEARVTALEAATAGGEQRQ